MDEGNQASQDERLARLAERDTKLRAKLASIQRDVDVRDETLAALIRAGKHTSQKLANNGETLALLRASKDKALKQYETATARTTLLEAKIADMQVTLDRRSTSIQQLRSEMAAIKGSISWRMTGPLRFVVRKVRRFVGSVLRKARQMLVRVLRQVARLGQKAATTLLPRPVKEGLKRAFPGAGPVLARLLGKRTAERVRKPKTRVGKIEIPVLRRTGDLAFCDDLPASAPRPWTAPSVLETKLWGGFSQAALADLEAVKGDASASNADRDRAAWALAVWYAIEGEHERAKTCFQDRLWTGMNQSIAINNVCLAAFSHMRVREFSAVREIAEHALRLDAKNPNLFLLAANGVAAEDGEEPQIGRDEERLAWINKAYEAQGFARLRKKDPEKPLSIGNLAADATRKLGAGEQGKVTVIVPAYNAEHELPLTLDSLLLQTWDDLEIIIVNDCSTDDTAGVIEDYARRDRRIVPLTQETNQGTYSGRNASLKIATGNFITVHDSGDWSHPQKIEEQVRRLVENSHLVANYSNSARVDDKLLFNAKFRQKHRLIDWNPSSLMFRRAVLKQLGAWDAVRISADAEFTNRLRRLFPERVVGVPRDQVPLALVHDQAGSLTSTNVTHGRTTYHGIRREYREASSNWHDNVEAEQLRLELNPKARPFPVPGLMLPERIREIECDLLLVADFNANANTLLTAISHARAAIRDGHIVALFHWRHYVLDVGEPLAGILRDMARAGEITIIAPGESVKTKRSIMLTPAVAQHEIDLAPKIETGDLTVIVDEVPGDTTANALAFDPRTVSENLQTVFGTPGTWHAVSALVRTMIEEKRIDGMPQLHQAPWPVLPDAADRIARPLNWRGTSEDTPHVLAMCEDNPTAFPADDAELLSALCAGQPCEVTIAGASDYIGGRLKKRPGNWSLGETVIATEPEAFGKVDFVVHYPAAGYLEKSPRAAILCAMAAGRPVIMTPALETVYGDAAIYAEPEVVWETVKTHWIDGERYLERTQKGRDFVGAQP